LSPWLKARLMAQPLLEETRAAMGKARNSLDPNKPQFSQVELCEVAEIPMATANNWILTGALRPADVGSRRARKPRLFSVVTIYEAKVTGDLVKWLGTPPPIAAGMARKTTDGHNWYWSIPRDLARNNPRDFFATVFWSDQCRDWDASVDVASGDVLRIKMKAIAEARGEPKLTERPILVLPVSKYFASVYKICQAMVDSSSKPGDA
jgi:hypothetical protein